MLRVPQLRACLTVVLCLLFLSLRMLGAENKSLSAPQFTTTNAVEITLEPSRLQPTAGTAFQINAVIKNVSQVPVLLSEHTAVVTLPGEIDPYNYLGPFYARFTTQNQPCKDNVKQEDCQTEALCVLPPGQSMHAFWRLDPQPALDISTGWWRQELESIKTDLKKTFFAPGNYKCSVQARYWPLLNNRTIKLEELRNQNYDLPDYQIATSTLTINVSAPEVVILFGAVIGGVMAFALGILRGQEPTGTPGTNEKLAIRGIRRLSGLVVAILLAIILTIMLSRLSDTPFPIKVTITDFWGAIVIGFVAAYSGNTLLDKYLPRGSAKL